MEIEGYNSSADMANWLHWDLSSPPLTTPTEELESQQYLLAMPVDVSTDEATAFLNSLYADIEDQSTGNGLDLPMSSDSSPVLPRTPDGAVGLLGHHGHSASTSSIISLESPSVAPRSSYWSMPYDNMETQNNPQLHGYTLSPNDFNASLSMTNNVNHPRTLLPFSGSAGTTTPGGVASLPIVDTGNKSLRKQSESRISLPELYQRMGLGHNHEEARTREQKILNILRQQGFKLGEKTWIRDTTDQVRTAIIQEIYRQTFADYGYSKELLEVIVRRGSYYMMQGRLRRIRRSKKAQQANQARQARLNEARIREAAGATLN
jgi:hypothetical protein